MCYLTELGGVEKVMVASAAGESDFVGAFSKEDLSSIDLRQQLILPATAREKLQDKDPEHQPGSDVEGADLAAQEMDESIWDFWTDCPVFPPKKNGIRRFGKMEDLVLCDKSSVFGATCLHTCKTVHVLVEIFEHLGVLRRGHRPRQRG